MRAVDHRPLNCVRQPGVQAVEMDIPVDTKPTVANAQLTAGGCLSHAEGGTLEADAKQNYTGHVWDKQAKSTLVGLHQARLRKA